MRLDCAPPDLARTREALHALAEQVLAPARVRATGNEIALRGHARGLRHAPAFPAGGRLRVQGAELVVEAPDGGEHRAPITSVSAAARMAGLDADELPGRRPRRRSAATAEFLGAFYAFADAQLRSLRANAEAPSPIHLWPEHFDLAFDAGDEAAGTACDLRRLAGRREPPRALPVRRTVAHARLVR